MPRMLAEFFHLVTFHKYNELLLISMHSVCYLVRRANLYRMSRFRTNSCTFDTRVTACTGRRCPSTYSPAKLQDLKHAIEDSTFTLCYSFIRCAVHVWQFIRSLRSEFGHIPDRLSTNSSLSTHTHPRQRSNTHST